MTTTADNDLVTAIALTTSYDNQISSACATMQGNPTLANVQAYNAALNTRTAAVQAERVAANRAIKDQILNALGRL